MSLTDDVSKFMEMSVDTQFANEFTLEKKEIFQKLLLEGHLYLVSETLSILELEGEIYHVLRLSILQFLWMSWKGRSLAILPMPGFIEHG